MNVIILLRSRRNSIGDDVPTGKSVSLSICEESAGISETYKANDTSTSPMNYVQYMFLWNRYCTDSCRRISFWLVN
jgi:hypothetical protein